MDPREQEAYEHLKAQLRVDLLRIDQHLIEHPQYLMDAAEYAAHAAKDKDEAEQVLASTKAEAAQRIRNSGEKKPAESQIATDVLLEESVMDQQIEVNNATHRVALWRALVDAMRAKGSNMKTAGELITSGYLSVNSVREGSRQDYQRARQGK